MRIKHLIKAAEAREKSAQAMERALSHGTGSPAGQYAAAAAAWQMVAEHYERKAGFDRPDAQ